MKARLDPVAALDVSVQSEMAMMLARYFSGVSDGQFTADLACKTHVLRLFDGVRLVGFSTIAYERIGDAGVIHSGDTIVDPEVWHSATLAPAWIAAVHAIHAGHGPLWWLLICSGLRTWRFLPMCCRDFVPRSDGNPALLAQRNHLGQRRYGNAFDTATGVVRLAKPQLLRDDLARIPPHLLADPAVAYFLHANPGWRDGDELCCLASLDEERLTPLGQRQLCLGRRLSP